MEKVEKFNKQKRSRIKVFELLKIFPNLIHLLMQRRFLMVEFINRSSKPVMKNSIVENIENARKTYKQLL